MFLITIALFCSCSDSIENDAARLAGLHLQKTELIRKLLSVSDSTEVVSLLDEYRELDRKYLHLKLHMENKYTDSLQGQLFDEAFKRALRHK